MIYFCIYCKKWIYTIDKAREHMKISKLHDVIEIPAKRLERDE